ncbi:MAG: NAD(P)-dependent alcohol dehydrogenase [Archangium sp.]|nr:NAD(P)-dependent alcohol dehydrogenase [Archangium sp.]
MNVHAWAATAANQPLAPFQITRREVGAKDVQLEILYSGICHSDIHQARGEWGNSKFPMVPGHEIIGRVLKVGANVTKFKVGDLAGVGCMVDSCRTCSPCGTGEEQFCEAQPAWTYNSTEMDRTTPTYGGYSTHVVVTEHFALKVPASLDLKTAAPLLCAGITTYSPLRQWNCKPGDKVAVMGLGGLGHMAVKLAAAMGAEVTVLSSSKAKEADAKRLGAADFASSTEKGSLKRLKNRFNLIIDCVSADHDFDQYLGTLAPFGALVLVGAPPKPSQVSSFALINNNRRLAGSSIGGIRQTQEMLDFCAEKKLGADIELIAAKDINVAYERMLKNDVRYRFVIDAKTFAT